MEIIDLECYTPKLDFIEWSDGSGSQIYHHKTLDHVCWVDLTKDELISLKQKKERWEKFRKQYAEDIKNGVEHEIDIPGLTRRK
tara:strand:- start:2469 stop:2720 length:252 start_codon:yes stop_codon:yes gene_type:complete